MKFMYLILARAGWVWLIIAAAIVCLRIRSLRRREMVSRHENQH